MSVADDESEVATVPGQRPLHGRADGHPVAWHKDDGDNILRNEIVDLVGLSFYIHVRIYLNCFITVLLRLGFDVISNHLKERVGQCERRVGDDSLAPGVTAIDA